MADTEHPDEDKRCTLFDKPKRFCQRCSEFHAADDWMETCERYLGGAPIRRCKTCGGDHPLDRWPHNCMPERNWNESDLNVCRNFISDNLESLGGLDGLKNMADGKHYTSKSRLRAEYRARGVEEVGNEGVRDHPSDWTMKGPSEREIERDIAMDIKKSLEQLSSDNFSDGQMKTMLQPENAPVEGGFSTN